MSETLSFMFSKELKYINNDTLRIIVEKTLDNSPKCISYIPASSSGKYHPIADLGEGGLVRHIITVTAIAKELMCSDLFKDMTKDMWHTEKGLKTLEDCAISACILHDCCKAKDNDENHTTVFEHPILASKLFVDTAKKYLTNETNEEDALVDRAYLKLTIPFIKQAIESHMGKWNESKYSDIKLPKPQNGLDNFVHLCDYIASRKIIDFNFDKYNEQ